MRNKYDVLQQNNLVKELSRKLISDIEKHEKARKSSFDERHAGLVCAPKKLQIQNDIVRLRRELLELHRGLEDWI